MHQCLFFHLYMKCTTYTGTQHTVGIQHSSISIRKFNFQPQHKSLKLSPPCCSTKAPTVRVFLSTQPLQTAHFRYRTTFLCRHRTTLSKTVSKKTPLDRATHSPHLGVYYSYRHPPLPPSSSSYLLPCPITLRGGIFLSRTDVQC